MKTTTQLRITVKVCTTFVQSNGIELGAREKTELYQILAPDALDAIGHVLVYHASEIAKEAKLGEMVSFHCPEFSEDNGKVWSRNPDVRFFGIRS